MFSCLQAVLDTLAAIDTTLIMDIMTMIAIHIDTATIPIVTTPMATMGIMVTHTGIATATAMVILMGAIMVGAIRVGVIVAAVITDDMRRFVSGLGWNEKEGVVMKCNRCGGMMVCEIFYSMEDNFLGWRCIFCGEIVDQLILENRHGQKY